jgi:hypothetical protein
MRLISEFFYQLAYLLCGKRRGPMPQYRAKEILGRVKTVTSNKWAGGDKRWL